MKYPGDKLKVLSVLLLLAANLASPTGATAVTWEAQAGDAEQAAAAAALERILAATPDARDYLQQAHAIAILPAVARAGLGLGGAYGRGLVIQDDAVIGRTHFYQFTSGIQAGGQLFSMLLVFRDPNALAEFQRGRIQFLGQASAVLVTLGVLSTPGYDPGVAMFAVTRGGLMLEASISGAWLTYRPAVEAAPAK